MMSSTRSRESAFRSSTNDASGLTSASSTPSCSMTIFFSRSYVLATDSLLGVLPGWALVAGDSPEHAVHEPTHRITGVGPCELDPFGDCHPGRRRGGV